MSGGSSGGQVDVGRGGEGVEVVGLFGGVEWKEGGREGGGRRWKEKEVEEGGGGRR